MILKKNYISGLLFLVISFFWGCDKKGNPLPSELKFSAKLNGMDFLDQMPMVIPPGARRTPVLEVEYFGTDKSYFQVRSFLKPVDQNNKLGDFYLLIRIPSKEQLSVGKAYTFDIIPGKDILTGIDRKIYEDENRLFTSISSSTFNIDTDYYGVGTVTFTEYDSVKNRARGKVDLVFPYHDSITQNDELELNGEFFCWINK